MNDEKKHKFGEAFMLMQYKCRDCGHTETIWNSRDGVVPFGCPCPTCGTGDMHHIHWDCDCYAPGHFPHRGQGVWIDMPRSLVPVVVSGVLGVYGDAVPPGLAEALTENYGPGTPWLIRWP